MIARDELIRKVDRLTPFSRGVLDATALLQRENADVREIVAALRYDPAITAQILRLCNSAALGLKRTVTSLKDATVYLGRRKLLEILLFAEAGRVMDGDQPGYGLHRGMLWRHSVAVALAAEFLGNRLKLDGDGLLFTAGLLHDIGKLVLSEYVASSFTQIVDRVQQGGATFIEAERELLGFSHDEVGAILAERWQLPAEIARCIRHHHQPSALHPPDPLVDVICLSNCVCLMLGVGVGEDGLFYNPDPAIKQRVGVRRADLAAAEVDVAVRLRELSWMFAQDRDACPAGA